MQAIKRVISRDIQNLIGVRQSYIHSKGEDGRALYETLCLSEFEKQVYLQAPLINVLTDSRVIEIQQLRPIDMLAMLIHLITTDQRTLYQQYDNLEEFIDFYTMRETCSMLLQMAVNHNGLFTFSKRVEDNMKTIQKQEQFNNQPSRMLSKSHQITKNRRGSPFDHSAYMMNDEGADIVKSRLLSSEERQTALSLLKRYGDSLVSIKQSLDIPEESLLGMPQNIQDFSIKHFVVYQYLQRILRPLWNTKLAYKLQNDSSYKPTFEQLAIPKKLLVDLLDFVKAYEQLLVGQIYQPNQKVEDKFVRNQAILNIIQPVYKLPNRDKDKLEIMEKNSMKNLKFFMVRCIQAIDMLNILTFSADNKMFSLLQKAFGDNDSFAQFANMTFKDLITTESNTLIKRLLEASVKVEINDAEDSQGVMRQKYANISKSCSTFFSKNENIAFIGVTLLQTAKKEKNYQKKEEILRQAITHLVSQPLNIDMTIVPQLLVENGNYSSLADLTLRKINALDGLSKDQRERLFSEDQYQSQLNQCYTIIISLFAAIDQSISKVGVSDPKKDSVDYIQFFLSKLNQVTNNELKIGLRDKIMKRIEQFNNEVVLTALFDYMIGRPTALMGVENLPQMSPKMLNRVLEEILKGDKVKLHKFDAIVRILMKRDDAERLCIVCINAITDKYKFVTEDQQSIPRTHSIEKKLQLLNTAQTHLSLHKERMSPETVKMLELTLKQLEETLDLQFEIMGEVKEVLSGLKQNIENQNRINALTNIQSDLAFKYYDTKSLNEIAKNQQLYSTMIKLDMKTDKDPQEILRSIDRMTAFYTSAYANNLQLLFAKWALFQNRRDYLEKFISSTYRSITQMREQANETDLLMQLIQQNVYSGNILEFLQFCIQSIQVLPFSLMISLIQIREGAAELTMAMIHYLAMIKFTVQHLQAFSKLPNDKQRLLRQDIQSHGAMVYSQFKVILQVIDEQESIFEAEVADQIKQFLPDLESRLKDILKQFGVALAEDSHSSIIPRQLPQQSLIEQQAEVPDSESDADLGIQENNRSGDSGF